MQGIYPVISPNTFLFTRWQKSERSPDLVKTEPTAARKQMRFLSLIDGVFSLFKRLFHHQIHFPLPISLQDKGG